MRAPRFALNIFAGADTAGQGIRAQRAINRWSRSWSTRCVVRSVNYIGYPVDVFWDERRVRELWARSDVVHAHNELTSLTVPQRRQPRPLVLHHHGTALRDHHRQVLGQARRAGAVQLVSTVDLLQYGEDLRWSPTPYDLAWLASHRVRDEGTKIRIAHAPTNRAIKSTDAILAAVERLGRRHAIEFDLIEGVSWAECLARKGRADIFVDQLILGYGCNSIEAWGMGIPVIAGVADGAVRERMLDLFGELPFHESSEATIETRLEELIVDAEQRQQWADRGRRHVQRFHDEQAVVADLEAVYAQAASQAPRAITRVSSGLPLRQALAVRRGEVPAQ